MASTAALRASMSVVVLRMSSCASMSGLWNAVMFSGPSVKAWLKTMYGSRSAPTRVQPIS